MGQGRGARPPIHIPGYATERECVNTSVSAVVDVVGDGSARPQSIVGPRPVQQAVVVGVVVVPVHVEAGARVVRRTGDHAVSHARVRVQNAVACAHVVRYQPTNLCIYIQGRN